MPGPPSSPSPRLPVPLELRACLLERASSSPAIRLPHHSSIAPISPMTVLFDFLSASNNGRNTGSPRVVVQSLQTLDSHHAAREIAARLITPISASDLAVRRTSSSLVFLRVSIGFLFLSISASSNLGHYFGHFISLPCTGSSITSAVPVELGCGLFCDVAKQQSTAVVVSLSILPHVEWFDTFCQGVQLSLLAFLVSS